MKRSLYQIFEVIQVFGAVNLTVSLVLGILVMSVFYFFLIYHDFLYFLFDFMETLSPILY